MTTATIDDVRRFWDHRPCNVRHSPAPVGSLEWSKGVSIRKYMVEPHIPGFAQFARWKGKRVLEVGCGIGTDTLEFLRAGAIVDALDLSAQSLGLTARRVIVHRDSVCAPMEINGAVSLYHMNAEKELPSGPYDLVYSFGVIHHTPCPGIVFANIHKVLKDDGELRFMLYARRSYKHWAGQQPEAQANCPIARTFTARDVREMLRANKFRVVSIRKTHIFPWRIEDYKQYRYVLENKWRWMPRFMFRACERLMGWHLLIVAKKA